MSLLNVEFSLWTLALIGIITVLTVYFQFFRYSSRTAESAPTILTSIGIFGTFLGVAIGLNNFDTSQLQESVPQLLSGLKTAFWSSIAGLLGALTIKFRAVMDATHGEEHHQRTASIDDLNDSMQAILKTLSQDENDTAYQQVALMRVEQKRQSEDLIIAMQH